MTGLATDIDLRKSRMVAIGGEIKVFVKVGAVTNRAGRVPILSGPGPMQWVRRIKLVQYVWRRKVKPLFLPRVPRDSKNLNPSDFVFCDTFGGICGTTCRRLDFDHILLQRFDAERVFDLVVVHLAVGALGVDHEAIAIAEHRRSHTEVLKRLVAKIGQH